MKQTLIDLYKNHKKLIFIFFSLLIAMIFLAKPLSNFLIKELNFKGMNVGSGLYTSSTYGSSGNNGSGEIVYGPECGEGYSDDNFCRTGKPNDLCKIGRSSNLKFNSVQYEKNSWSWMCTENRKTISCGVKDASQCVIFSVEGVGFGGYFTEEVENVAKPYSCENGYKKIKVEPLGSKNDDIAELALTIENNLKSFYDNQDQNEKILVAGHSMGAVASFLNEIIGQPNMDTDFLYYDPPYNYPWVKTAYLLENVFGSILSIFSANVEKNIKNGELIYYSKKHGLIGDKNTEGEQGNPKVIDWSGGYDDPESEKEKYLHSLYWHEKGKHLGEIRDWIKDQCKR